MWMRLRRHSLFHICGESLSSVLAYYDDVPEVDLMKIKEGGEKMEISKVIFTKDSPSGFKFSSGRIFLLFSSVHV